MGYKEVLAVAGLITGIATSLTLFHCRYIIIQ